MELKMLNAQGQDAGTMSAPETVFGREYNEALVHQIVVAYQANARQGTRAQKDRTTVKHSTRKPWRQRAPARACRDDFKPDLARRWPYFSEFARREFFAQGQQEDVSRGDDVDLVAAGAR